MRLHVVFAELDEYAVSDRVGKRSTHRALDLAHAVVEQHRKEQHTRRHAHWQDRERVLDQHERHDVLDNSCIREHDEDRAVVDE